MPKYLPSNLVPHQRTPLWLRNCRRREVYGRDADITSCRVRITSGLFKGLHGVVTDSSFDSLRSYGNVATPRRVYDVEVVIFGQATTATCYREELHLRRLDRRRRKPNRQTQHETT